MREPISIVISSYEQFEYTKKAVESIRQYESTIDDEIIIVDDGSSDDTICGLRFLVDNTAGEIRVIEMKNQGHPSLARNRQVGRGEASRNWVLWMDNDVEWRFGDFVGRLQMEWNTVPNTGAIQPQRINQKGSIYGACRHKQSLEYDGSNTKDTIATGMYPEGACWMSHRVTFEDWRFDVSLRGFEDSDLGYQFWEKGLSVVCVNDVQVYHRQWTSGAWNYVAKHPECRMQVISKWASVSSRRYQ
jgi:glycosyltransferase involved in cell wall biosynthesis